MDSTDEMLPGGFGIRIFERMERRLTHLLDGISTLVTAWYQPLSYRFTKRFVGDERHSDVTLWALDWDQTGRDLWSASWFHLDNLEPNERLRIRSRLVECEGQYERTGFVEGEPVRRNDIGDRPEGVANTAA